MIPPVFTASNGAAQPMPQPAPQGANESLGSLLQPARFGKALHAASIQDALATAEPPAAPEDDATAAVVVPPLLSGFAVMSDMRVAAAPAEPNVVPAATGDVPAAADAATDASQSAVSGLPANLMFVGYAPGVPAVVTTAAAAPVGLQAGQSVAALQQSPGFGSRLTQAPAPAPAPAPAVQAIPLQPSVVRQPADQLPESNMRTPMASLPAKPDAPSAGPVDAAANQSLPAAATARQTQNAPGVQVALTAAHTGVADERGETPLPANPLPGVPLQAGDGSTPMLTSAAAITPKPMRGATGAVGQQLMAALGERIDVQVRQGVQLSTIRLDPPLLGSIEISIRYEGGALQVHLAASSPEVVQQLQAVSDGLRQDLSGRQYTQVAVQVSHGDRSPDGRDGQPQQQAGTRQERPGRALAEADEGYDHQGFSLG